MLVADTVMDAVRPRFQIGENEVDDGQKVVGNLGIATLGDGMKVNFSPGLSAIFRCVEKGPAIPIVGVDLGTR